MHVEPISSVGYKLLHDGVVALSDVECNGMRIDTVYLEKADRMLSKKIRKIKTAIFEDEHWHKWRRRWGSKASPTSGEQLSWLLFEELGYPVTSRTDAGNASTDESHLSVIKLPIVSKYLKLSKCIKAKNTYLQNIRRETQNGYIHPVFNLSTVQTYRSSSNSPNFQNMPVRDAWMGALIRTAFVPRPGCFLMENDYGGVEVRVAACYHKDPTMLSYILDTSRDMHRDMAAQIYMMPEDKVEKGHRHAGKNKFVFPQFYGDFYVNCAKAMWEEIGRGNLQGPDGESMYEYLAANGITERGACSVDDKPVKGTFEYHMREVENDFWNNRFGVYGQWKRDWIKQYERKGFFDTLTGFRITGDLKRNQIVNFPVQGSAFHCLLWSAIQVNKELRRRKMKTKIIGQIHDSLVSDVVLEEADEYLALVHDIMTKRVHEYAPWLIVPLGIEAEVTPMNGTWHDKLEIEFGDTFAYSRKNAPRFVFNTLKELMVHLTERHTT